MSFYLILAVLVILFFIIRNICVFIFSLENYNIHKKRLKQLKFNKKHGSDIDDLIDTVTKPAITYILPRIKLRNMEKLEIDLKMAKWNKYFTPMQYRALNITLKVIGVIMFLLFFRASKFIAVLWAVILCFVMDLLFYNSISERKKRLLSDFPDFLRITQGYLSANIPFSKAVSETIKYVGDEWKPILRDFVVECDVKSIEDALENLKNRVDMFEVREFVALVKLAIEQGGDAKDSFTAQADKIREMQMDIIALKVGRRQLMGTLIQAPLLLCNLLVIGLPVISSMTGFTTM